MKLQLVKEYSKKGEVSYHVHVDGELVPDSTRYDLHDALNVFEVIKTSRTMARTVVLVEEEVWEKVAGLR